MLVSHNLDAQAAWSPESKNLASTSSLELGIVMLPARHGPTVQEVDDRASCIVWPAARVLLQWLRASLRESLGTELAGATVLELGAGTGFLALALAEAGAGKVFAVEGDEDAWENLKQNVRASAKVQPVFWNWETDPSMPQEVPLQSVQLVVASDVVYPRYYNERALAQLIQGRASFL